jgi:hypothetical protein
MPEFEELNSLSHPLRFLSIHCGGASGCHRAVMATPGTYIPKDQKRGRPVIPTFPYVGTSSFFTNRMQLMSIHQLADFLVMGARPEADFKPGREGFSA